MNCEKDEEMLTRGLRALADEMESLEAPRSVELKVLEAFRARRVVVPMPVKRSSSRYWWAAVAAVLLIALSLVALRWRSNDVETPRQALAPPPPAAPEKREVIRSPEESPKPVEYQAVNEPPKGPVRKPRHQRPFSSENAQMASLQPDEITTDFIPLRYMNAANLQEGGQIVRVELPRSALANFGLPVNMERYNERVKADVLYGVDGLAHAIRFVK